MGDIYIIFVSKSYEKFTMIRVLEFRDLDGEGLLTAP